MEILISGASTGIGRAAAIHLARRGHSVWAGVRHPKAAEEIVRMNVRGLRPLTLDVCDEKSIAAALSLIRKDAGALHALVNNAGIVVAGPVEAVPLSDWRRQFETNVFGAIRLTQECLPLLRETKGRIVNVSSISGRVASPYLAPYSASKFALEAISDSLRRELRKHGVRVSVIEPGPIQTPIWEKSRQAKINFGENIEALYGASLTRFMKEVDRSERTASPVSVVIQALEHALTSRRPRTRYPVGRGIPLTAALSNALPDSWMDRILASRL